MEAPFISVLATMLAYSAAIVVFVILVIKKRPKYIVSENGIFIDDLAYAMNIPNNTIKSVKLIDKLPKIIVKNDATKWKNIRRGNFMLKLENGVKESLLYVEDCTKSPVIELITTSNQIYINMGDEEFTTAMFNEISEKVRFVSADKLVVYKYKRKQKMLWIICGVVFVATGLFTFVMSAIIS